MLKKNLIKIDQHARLSAHTMFLSQRLFIPSQIESGPSSSFGEDVNAKRKTR